MNCREPGCGRRAYGGGPLCWRHRKEDIHPDVLPGGAGPRRLLRPFLACEFHDSDDGLRVSCEGSTHDFMEALAMAELNRHTECRHYDACLDAVAGVGWKNWSCVVCDHWRLG